MDNPQQNKDIKKKTKLTNIAKYGASVYCNSEEGKRGIKESCIEKYGVEHWSSSIEGRLSNTLAGYIKRHGEKQGTILYNNKGKNVP